MELEPTLKIINIAGEDFEVIKPTRLLPGMVLKSCTRGVFARIGPKQSALEEQIHTVSLHERGFPVARVLSSGPRGADEWFFTEESLGDKTFHVQFAEEYEADGSVSGKTFARYLRILDEYVAAQYSPANRTNIPAEEFVQNTIPDERIIANYQACGGDVARYHEAVARATDKLSGSPMGVLQLDLNPSNVLERGIIDFELVGYGPLGYDSSMASLWHRWFTSDQSSRYRIAYKLSEEQVSAAQILTAKAARDAGAADPQKYMQEFLLIKTAWGFNSNVALVDEPKSKRAFYHYRAALLSKVVEDYLTDAPILVLEFPDVHELPDEAAATHPTQPIQ